ncbi:MAG: hypothetical protein K2F63_00770, partial [Muribaculaceae bacterium]|nr:hypothetical protein [Muribaculaceae bacterium]
MKICPRFFTLVLSLALCSELVQVRAEETPTPLVGFMYSSDAWRDAQDAIALYGFYSFKSDGSGDFSALSPIGPDNGWAKNGGTFANNKFYGYTAEGTWLNYTLSYTVMDAKDWSLVTSASHNFKYADSGSEESQKARRIPSAVFYDPIGETMYAFTHKFGNSDSGEFVSVDTATGEFTKISDSPYVSASACDATGQIFAIALDGNLYTVSHEGEFTLVGHTGYYPTRDSNLNGGAAFDFRTGKLFWTFYGFADPDDRNYNRNGLSALFTVDTTTGAAELSWSYPRMQYISSLCVQNAHPNAPDAISDLSFGSSEPLSERGVIS